VPFTVIGAPDAGVIVSTTVTLKVATPVEKPQPISGLVCCWLSTLTFAPFGAVIRQSKRYGPSPPLADATNRHVTGPVDGATHGVFWTANDPVSTGMLVVVGAVVVVDVVVVVVAGAVVVVVVLGPVPPPHVAQSATAADASAARR